MRASMWLLLCVSAAALTAAEGSAQPGQFVVIVHPSNDTSVVDRDLMSRVFLRKVSRWEDGRAVRPVDLPPSSPVRDEFSDKVLRRSISAVRSYWQQAIFSGRGVPPPELANDEAVVAYVLRHEGAVGYVSRGANVGGAKVLSVR